MSLGLLADLKADLNISSSNNDTVLQRFLDAATAFIQGYTSRDLVQNDYVENYDGPGGAYLGLNQWPITSVGVVAVNGQAIPQGQVYPSLVYGWIIHSKLRGLVLVGEPASTTFQRALAAEGFSIGMQNVHIEYQAGYAPGDVPQDLQQACCAIAGTSFKRFQRGLDIVGQNIANMGQITVSRQDMDDTSRLILTAYRRLR